MGEQNITPRIAQLVLELLTLNTVPRSWWQRVRIPVFAQQTVASHTFGAVQIALVLAVMASNGETVNVARTVELAALHDIGKTRTGDIARLLREILEEQGISEEQIDQRAEYLQRQGLPRRLQNYLRGAVNEYRQGETIEAKIAYNAELIDMGIQALLYERQGYGTEEFTLLEDQLRTEVGKELWQIIVTDPDIFTSWFSRRRS